jgi:hypothetical protein
VHLVAALDERAAQRDDREGVSRVAEGAEESPQAISS